ncbi:ABC transporter substrate-binding protein [Roseomonas sp. CCTCC AB2023176]|uniref:ABC transporter substrate-binding protein n=1 Tax=Roseomonas sp. CCTCC AB2023176 TaxID=3342640 RepID=UPI0035D5D73C
MTIRRILLGRRTLLAASAATLARPALSQRRLIPAATQLGWLRNGEFAAIIVAEAQGYFEAEGIQHRIMDGGPGRNPIPTVAVGQAQFGLATSSSHLIAAKVARDPVDVIAVGTLYQQGPAALLRLANPGDPEPTPRDLDGKSVGVQAGSEYLVRALARVNGVNPDRVRIVTAQANAEPLLVGRVDYFLGWVTNQAYQIEQEIAKPDAPANLRGKTWQGIRFGRWGVRSYADTIFTTTRFAQDNPEVVQGYLRAVQRAVRFILDNPAESVTVVARFPGQVESAERLTWRWNVQNPLYVSDATNRSGLLFMEDAVWSENSAVLREANEIPRDVAPADIMTNRFLPAPRPA